jgi:hypothetical protein
MAHALRRKTGDDALYGCGLCGFLDGTWLAAEQAAVTLRAVEEHLAILRRTASELQAPLHSLDALLMPLHKERRTAIRTLVNAGRLEPLVPFLKEWGRFGDWKPLRDYADAVRRCARPDRRLLATVKTDQEHLSCRIDDHDTDLASRDACRRHLPALAVDCFIGGAHPLAAWVIIIAMAGRRAASSAPVRSPLVPGSQASVIEDTAYRARLRRLTAAGIL